MTMSSASLKVSLPTVPSIENAQLEPSIPIELVQRPVAPRTLPDSTGRYASRAFLLSPGAKPSMHDDVALLKPPNTAERYSSDLGDRSKKELQEIAQKVENIGVLAQVRYPLAGKLLAHYASGSGRQLRIDVPLSANVVQAPIGDRVLPFDSDVRRLGDIHGDMRHENLHQAKAYFEAHPTAKSVTVRSPWIPVAARPENDPGLYHALHNFYVSTVSTVHAVRSGDGQLLGLRDHSTAVATDWYDFSNLGGDLYTPLGKVNRVDLHAIGHPGAQAARGFRVFSAATLTSARQTILQHPAK